MGYRSIVIGSSVRMTVKNGQLIIEGEAKGTVPIEDIRTLIIESRSSNISTYALSALSEEGVCVYLCDDKHMPCGVIMPFGRYTRQKKSIMSQMSQTQPHLKRLWQSIVISKIKNQAKCLELCGVDKEYYEKIRNMSPRVQSGDASNVEAQAAALYFRYLFGNGFCRGDDTGINAALNYGYAIIRGYIARILADCGFEPCIGIHHRSELNNFNLADDLIEPLRPLVDLYVFQHLPVDDFLSADKREICNILNYELLSGGEHHSAAYAIERMIHSLERDFDSEDPVGLLLPGLQELKRHEYE